jgi:Arc/MetJ-type ribon-helix-helix transcriptional regulator
MPDCGEGCEIHSLGDHLPQVARDRSNVQTTHSCRTKKPGYRRDDLPEGIFSPTLKMTNARNNTVTINLTPEQERRIRAVLDRGAYKSVEEVVEAALMAVEQRTVPGFAGTPEELDALLAEGFASKQLTEDDFWSSVRERTDALLDEHKTGPRW